MLQKNVGNGEKQNQIKIHILCHPLDGIGGGREVQIRIMYTSSFAMAYIISVTRAFSLTRSHSLFDWHYPHPQRTNIEFENEIKHWAAAAAVIHCMYCIFLATLSFCFHRIVANLPGRPSKQTATTTTNRLPINNQPATLGISKISPHASLSSLLPLENCCVPADIRSGEKKKNKKKEIEINAGDRYRQMYIYVCVCALDGSTGEKVVGCWLLIICTPYSIGFDGCCDTISQWHTRTHTFTHNYQFWYSHFGCEWAANGYILEFMH